MDIMGLHIYECRPKLGSETQTSQAKGNPANNVTPF